MLESGKALGNFDILSPLGAGGMGEVWRARDRKLKREVALKTLPESFAADPERQARFQREAQTLASLNHPNIAAIHDLAQEGREWFLVLELVEGETLAERIRQGAIPVAEILPIARQITDALEAAHEKGVVHRDLKPANIKITPEGKIKVLDFGLAKVVETSPGGAALSQSPTVATSMAVGVILGTPAYLSPEQARGKAIDKRTDIWAFGCVLYEMLTGRQAFTGETVSDVMAAILTREADIRALPDIPVKLRDLLERCLQKDPTRRLRDIGDARIAIEEMLAPTTSTSSTPVRENAPAWSRRRWLLAVAGSFAAGSGAMWLGELSRGSPGAGWSGTKLGGPEIANGPRVSPNGSLIAFGAIVDGQMQVCVMQQSGDWRPLTSDKARGYLSSVSWSADGNQLYYGRVDGVPRGVFTIPALGGDEERIVLEDAACPEVLPDGSLVVVQLNDKRLPQIYRHWPGTSRDRVGYPANPSVYEGNPIRPFRDGKEVVFWGRSADQPESDPDNHLYALELEAKSVRRIQTDTALLPYDGFFLPIAIGPDDKTVLTWTKKGDLSSLLEIPRGGGPSRELTSVTKMVWGFDITTSGDLYIDQISRPAEILSMEADGSSPQSILVSGIYYDVPPAVLADGRLLFTTQVGGRRRLLVTRARSNPTPFVQTTDETSGPVTMVGPSEVGFLLGSGQTRRLAIASAVDGRVLRPVEQADGPAIQALVSSPDGQTLYYAANGKIWAIPSKGGSPTVVREGDSVAVDPLGQYLVIQLNERDNVRLVRLPLHGGPEQTLLFPGVRPAPLPLAANSVRRDGAIVKNINSSDYYPWSPAVFFPNTGKVRRVPLPSFLDTHFATWGPDGRIVVFGQQSDFSLWRLSRSQT